MTVPCYYFKYQISNYYLPSATTVFISLFAAKHKNKFTFQSPVAAVCTDTLNSPVLEINSCCNVQNPILKLHYLISLQKLLTPPPHKKSRRKKPQPGLYKNRHYSPTNTLRHSRTESAPCNAAYVSFGSEGLQKRHVLSSLCIYVSCKIIIINNINYFPLQH